MKVKIRNAQTGEVKEIDDSQLGDYGLNVQASANPAPVDNSQPVDQPQQSNNLGDFIVNTLLPATKKYLSTEPQKFIDAANTNRPKDLIGGALKDFSALSMVLGDAVKPALETGSLASAGSGQAATEGASGISRFLAGTFGKNALAGAVNATSTDNLTPTSVLTGGITGGAGGVIGENIGKIIGGLGKFSNKVADTTENVATSKVLKASPTAAANAIEDHGFDINKVFQDNFGKETNYDKMLGPVADRNSGGILGNKIKAAEDIISSNIKQSGSVIKFSPDELTSALDDEARTLGKIPGNEDKISTIKQFITDTQKRFKNGATANQLLDLKRAADSKFGKAVVEEQTGSAITSAQKVIANAARKLLKTRFPDIAGALDKESELYTLKPILSKARGAGVVAGKSGMPMLDTILAGGAMLGHPVVAGAGYAAKKLADSPDAMNILSSVARKGGSLEGKVFSPQTQALLTKAGAIGGSSLGKPNTTDVNTNGNSDIQDNVQSDASISNPSTESKTRTGFTVDQLGQAYTVALLTGKTDAASQLKDLYDVESKYQDSLTKADALTPAQQTRHDSLQTALSSLDGAETNLVTAGGAKGALGAAALIPGLNQIVDPSGAAYHSTKIELATQLAKAITGGARPGAEVIQQYLHSLPDVNDQPKYAAEKIAKLRSELMTQVKSFNYKDLMAAYQ